MNRENRQLATTNQLRPQLLVMSPDRGSQLNSSLRRQGRSEESRIERDNQVPLDDIERAHDSRLRNREDRQPVHHADNGSGGYRD